MPLVISKSPLKIAPGAVVSPEVAARVSVLVLFIKKVSFEAVVMLLSVRLPAPESNVIVEAVLPVLIETSLPAAGTPPLQFKGVDQFPLPMNVQLLVVMLAPIGETVEGAALTGSVNWPRRGNGFG